MLRFPVGNHKKIPVFRTEQTFWLHLDLGKLNDSCPSTMMWDKIVIVVIFIKGRVPACYRHINRRWVLASKVSYGQRLQVFQESICPAICFTQGYIPCSLNNTFTWDLYVTLLTLTRTHDFPSGLVHVFGMDECRFI